MKWKPMDAVAAHAAQVLADPRSSPDDAAAARRAIADPHSAEALEALPESELERLLAEDDALIARLGATAACLTCGAACERCTTTLDVG